MPNEPDLTESLLTRTKRLLADRGDTPLREIAEGAEVEMEWLKSIAYGRIKNPGVLTLEKLHAYLIDWHAARRFQQRNEVRAG
jgi:hypothetical protein